MKILKNAINPVYILGTLAPLFFYATLNVFSNSLSIYNIFLTFKFFQNAQI